MISRAVFPIVKTYAQRNDATHRGICGAREFCGCFSTSYPYGKDKRTCNYARSARRLQICRSISDLSETKRLALSLASWSLLLLLLLLLFLSLPERARKQLVYTSNIFAQTNGSSYCICLRGGSVRVRRVRPLPHDLSSVRRVGGEAGTYDISYGICAFLASRRYITDVIESNWHRAERPAQFCVCTRTTYPRISSACR